MANNKLRLVVDSDEIEQLNTSWEERREELKISRQELQLRVLALRAELESYRDRRSSTSPRTLAVRLHPAFSFSPIKVPKNFRAFFEL